MRKAMALSIGEITNTGKYNSLAELKKDYEIWSTMSMMDYDTSILKMMRSKWAEKRFYLFGIIQYLIGFIFMIVFPFVVGKYLLLLFLILPVLGFMASGIIKTPFYGLYWIISVISGIATLFIGNYEALIMVIVPGIMLYSMRGVKIWYRDALLRCASNNELKFKFLFYLGLVELRDKMNDRRVSSMDIDYEYLSK